MLADLSPLKWPDVPQSCASPGAEHSSPVWHPTSLGLIRQRSDELIHNSWSPASLVAVMAAAYEDIPIWKWMKREQLQLNMYFLFILIKNETFIYVLYVDVGHNNFIQEQFCNHAACVLHE